MSAGPNPPEGSLDKEAPLGVPDCELSPGAVGELLDLGREEGVNHKHQRFRVPACVKGNAQIR